MTDTKHVPARRRLDALMAERNLSASREKAKVEIIAGWVKVDGETVRDPSRRVAEDAPITVGRPSGLFVSRGGEKLRYALEYFGIQLGGKVAADLGASTGGFTDCMLKNGALQVYAVDVGYGQLDYSLRQDHRVVVMERRHVNSLNTADFPRRVEFFTADLSFISVGKVIARIMELFPGVPGVILVKPQFESLRSENKKGVVRKLQDHRAILLRVLGGLVPQDITLLGCVPSPLKGPKGNIEFLLHVLLEPPARRWGEDELAAFVEGVVSLAHGSGESI